MPLRKTHLFALWLLASVVWGDVVVTARASPTTVHVGDQIDFLVVVTYPSGAHVGILAKADSTLGPFKILSAAVDTAPAQEGKKTTVMRFRLAYFGLGDAFIPPVGVVVAEGNRADTLFTQPIRVSFRSLLGEAPVESLDIRDVKPPRPLPRNYKRLFLSVVCGFLAGFLALGLLWYRRQRERGVGLLEFIAPPKPPWKVAMMKLDALAESELLGKGELKEYFDRLSDILREYIEGRFGVEALELSTTETLENLRCARLELDTTTRAWFEERVEELLRRADLVKFAKVEPDVTTALSDLKSVREIVERTIPVKKEEETQEGNVVA